MKKFLIVKTSSLGDIIQAFPALGYLRSKFPDAQIDWVVEKSFAELIQCHPDINQVHLVDSKKWRKGLFKLSHWKEMCAFKKKLQLTTYDAVFDLQGNIKSGLITAIARSSSKVGFGWETVHEKPNTLFTNKRYNPAKGVNIREDNLLVTKGFFNDTTISDDTQNLLNISSTQEKTIEEMINRLDPQKMKVMVCSGSAWPNKQLTKEALFDFLKRLQNYLSCSFVFVWGTAAEKEVSQELQSRLDHSILLDRIPLPVLQNFMSRMDLVIAMDSLPLHLAGTTQTKTFSVFGASSASKFKPLGINHLSYQGTCPYGRQFEKRCPILRTCPTGACIRDLSGETIFHSFCDQWKNRQSGVKE